MEEKNKIGLSGLVAIGIGSVIGAGIFSMMGTAIGSTGRSVPVALILASFLVFGQNFRPFMLSSMFALDGGRYEQSALTVPPLISGATAVNFLMQNLSRSVMAIGIAEYLGAIVPSLADHITLVAFIVMTLAFATSLLGNTFIAKIQTVIVVCMYLSLGLFAVFGILNRDPSAYAGEPYFHNGGFGLLAATVAISYACQGAPNIIDVTKDAKEPKKLVPKALVLTTVAVAIMYAVLGYAASCSMPYAEIAGQNLGVVARQVMPTSLFLFFVIGGAIGSLATTLLGCIAAMPWPIYASARDGWLPAVFKKTTKKGYPWVVMIAMYLIAIIPILGGFSLSTIVSYLLVPGAIINIAANLANFRIPEQFPEAWEGRTIRLSATGYRICNGISCVLNAVVALISLSTLDTFNLCCNLAMTAFLFLWAWIRMKMNKVELESRKVHAEK